MQLHVRFEEQMSIAQVLIYRTVHGLQLGRFEMIDEISLAHMQFGVLCVCVCVSWLVGGKQ